MYVSCNFASWSPDSGSFLGQGHLSYLSPTRLHKLYLYLYSYESVCIERKNTFHQAFFSVSGIFLGGLRRSGKNVVHDAIFGYGLPMKFVIEIVTRCVTLLLNDRGLPSRATYMPTLSPWDPGPPAAGRTLRLLLLSLMKIIRLRNPFLHRHSQLRKSPHYF